MGYGLWAVGSELMAHSSKPSHIRPFVRGELNVLRGQIGTALRRTLDTATRYHLENAIVRIDDILDPQ